MLANWFDDDAILRKRQEFMAREYDVHWQLLSHDALGAYTCSNRYAGGLLDWEDAGLPLEGAFVEA